MVVDSQDIQNAVASAKKRLDHTASHGEQLAADITAWLAKNPIRLESSIADDRLSWQLALVIDPAAPLDDWGFVFGDAIHDLRSTLNTLLSRIAIASGATAKEQLAVQFPTARDASEWKNQQRWIAMLPQEVQTAIESVQPFQRPGFDGSPAENDPLAVLTSFNNQDKHRLELSPSVTPAELGHEFSVEFEDGPTGSLPPRVEINGDMTSGSVILRQDTTPDRIKTVKGNFTYSAQVVVVHESGVNFEVTESLAASITYVGQILDHIVAAWANSSQA